MAEEVISSVENEATTYVFNLFKDKLSDKYIYHDYAHTLETVKYVKEISQAYELALEDLEIVILAAIFHDTGHIESYREHEEASARIAQKFLQSIDYEQAKIDKVEELILSTKLYQPSEGLLQEILHDADLINIGKKGFFSKGRLLRAEWDFFLDKKFSDESWEKLQYEFLLKVNFCTAYAQENYGKRRSKNITKQQNRLIGKQDKKKKKKGKKAKSRKAGRGIETMYRSTYRNHINLSSIADNKANMMISINTIIMSVIITVIGSGFTFTGQDFIEHLRFSVPIVILLLTCLVSVIYAVFSARPSVTSKEVDKEKIRKKQTSILFFGNFTHLPLQEYLEDMNQLMRNGEMLYDNMSIDIYFLGQVLTKKYNLLRVSYNIFMIGLSISVIAFVIIFFYSYALP
ncbi:MAG: Pycsar system effector family protein [Candidatus Cyclobacteriaceae bacterium M3_2C_046]